VLARAHELGLVEHGRGELTMTSSFVSSRARILDGATGDGHLGRGVGIDAVHARVRALGGTWTSDRRRVTARRSRCVAGHAGDRAVAAGAVGDETYAIPMTHVNETVHLEPNTIRHVKGAEVLVLRGDVLPLLHLRDVVRLPRRDAGGGQVVVLEVADRRAGMVVDELTGQQEIVIKPFDAVRDGLSVFSGRRSSATGCRRSSST
jgi:two-component system chemotaxis sensor kinase CheA